MRAVMRLGVAAALAVAGASPGAAAEADCAAGAAPPPPALAGWAAATPLRSGASATAAPVIAPGIAADVRLLPVGTVRFAAAPEKPGGAGSHGGVLGLTVAQAGTYRVALGAGAWVDVVRGGKALASTAHGHGPACTGIRKMVDFALKPGRYLLQFAGNANPVLRVMVTRLD